MSGSEVDRKKFESGSTADQTSSPNGCASQSTQTTHAHGELPRRLVVRDDVLSEILMCFSASRTLDEVINLLNQ